MNYTRREFVKRTAIVGAAAALPWKLSAAKPPPPPPPPPGTQILLAPKAIKQFVSPLPRLADMDIIDTTGLIKPGSAGVEVKLEMREFQVDMLPVGTFQPGVQPKTWAWGYVPAGSNRKTYLGPIVIAKRGTPTQMRYINNLGNAETTNVLAYKNSTDLTLAWADPLNNERNSCAELAAIAPGTGVEPSGACSGHYVGPIPACVHIHGGEVPAGLDGGPDAWYTSSGGHQGHGYYSHPSPVADPDGTVNPPAAPNESVYRYPNTQESAPVWFHDHTLGATRLNVYAGLAGGYYLIDPEHDRPDLPELEALIIQDRMFDTNGQLYFPAGMPFIPNPDHPYWVPEFEGNVICVNGKAWPVMDVEPKRYQFLLINGSNARTYEMFLTNNVTKVMGPAIWQIGTDGGYLDAPVKIDPLAPKPQPTKLVLMPGERATIIVDFTGQPLGTTIVLKNIARHPYPAGVAVNGTTTGQIMMFRVGALKAPDNSYNPASGLPLRANNPIVRLANPVTGTPLVTPALKRQLTLNEIMGPPVIGQTSGLAYPGGPLEVVVNNTKYNGTARGDFTPVDVNGNLSYYSEIPVEGRTELWEIINLTADAHPMHTHLAQFQVLNRQAFDVPGYLAAYALAFGGVIKDGYGPPLDYNNTPDPVTGLAPNIDGALGGNPGVTPFLKGPIKPPVLSDAGWKDTVRVMPGEVTRILVRFAPTDVPANEIGCFPFKPCTNDVPHGYVWHCHIVDHEDNEMMRPFFVAENPDITPERTFLPGIDY